MTSSPPRPGHDRHVGVEIGKVMRRERGEHGAPENARVEDQDQHRVFPRRARRALVGVRARPGRPRGVQADHERGHLGHEGRDARGQAGHVTADQPVVDRLQLGRPLRVHEPVAVEAAELPAPALVTRDQDRAQQAGIGGLGLPLLHLARVPSADPRRPTTAPGGRRAAAGPSHGTGRRRTGPEAASMPARRRSCSARASSSVHRYSSTPSPTRPAHSATRGKRPERRRGVMGDVNSVRRPPPTAAGDASEHAPTG